MDTEILKLDSNDFRSEELEKAAQIIREGGLVAFPTETVYGLGANALNEQAAQKIYKAKGRPSDNPLIVHIAHVSDMEKLALEVPQKARQLAEVFWPGPLTIILKKADHVPDGTTGGLNTVAIRMPANKIAREFIHRSKCYIAAPSANLSGKPSTTKAEHVIQDLDGKVNMIIDGGKATLGLESTIVDLTGEQPVILRPGSITQIMLENVIGSVGWDPTILSKNTDQNIAPRAPGMKYRHYAPEGALTIYEGKPDCVIRAINQVAKEKTQMGKTVGIIATDETKNSYRYGIVKTIGSRENEETIAAGLYDVLRDFDQLHAEYIYTESFANNRLGIAIMNRLLKAAGYKIINVTDTDDTVPNGG